MTAVVVVGIGVLVVIAAWVLGGPKIPAEEDS